MSRPGCLCDGSVGVEMQKISIIMGIYNCESTLEEAINSIICQTYSEWELILCDDGSADQTFAVAQEWRRRFPEKIKLLQNEHNRGLNYTLNRCLKEATGTYIARMDADDRCAPERFEMEVSVLESEPEIAIVSTDMEHFDESGTWGCQSHPEYPQPRDFIHGTPFCHAPCMVRREAYEAVNGYSEEKCFLRVEDYHLWLKMYKTGFRGKNIHRILYQMRDDRNAYSRRRLVYRINEARVKALAVRELRLPVSGYLYAIRPILVGLIPGWLYDRLHKRNLYVRHS